jgi:hypothetical protein
MPGAPGPTPGHERAGAVEKPGRAQKDVAAGRDLQRARPVDIDHREKDAALGGDHRNGVRVVLQDLCRQIDDIAAGQNLNRLHGMNEILTDVHAIAEGDDAAVDFAQGQIGHIAGERIDMRHQAGIGRFRTRVADSVRAEDI